MRALENKLGAELFPCNTCSRPQSLRALGFFQARPGLQKRPWFPFHEDTTQALRNKAGCPVIIGDLPTLVADIRMISIPWQEGIPSSHSGRDGGFTKSAFGRRAKENGLGLHWGGFNQRPRFEQVVGYIEQGEPRPWTSRTARLPCSSRATSTWTTLCSPARAPTRSLCSTRQLTREQQRALRVLERQAAHDRLSVLV